jgi:hypothetical protein
LYQTFDETQTILHMIWIEFCIIQSREKTRQIILQMISDDGQTLYRSVMLHGSNPIKGLYFDMSTKSYADVSSQPMKCRLSFYKGGSTKCYRGFRISPRVRKSGGAIFSIGLKLNFTWVSPKHLCVKDIVVGNSCWLLLFCWKVEFSVKIEMQNCEFDRICFISCISCSGNGFNFNKCSRINRIIFS